MKNIYLIKKFLPYYKKHKKTLCFTLFCAILTTTCEMAFPLIVRYITDTATTNLQDLALKSILILGGLFLILKLIDIVARYFMQNQGHVMGAKIETDMRSDLFNKLLGFSFGYYSTAKVGSLMSRMTSDLFDITEFAHHCPEEFLIATVKIIVSFIILSTFNFYLTLIIFLVLPIMLLVTNKFNLFMRRGFKKQRQILAEVNSQIEDSLLGIRVVKSFNGESKEIEKFEEGNERFLDIKKRNYKIMAYFTSTTRAFDGLMYIIVVVLGSIFLINKKISIGEFTAYLLYIGTLLESVRRIIEFTEQFQRGMSGIERFVEILDTPIDIENNPQSISIGKATGDLSLKNISFCYPDTDEPVLDNFNLDIKAGENVAIVGSSGGGKTTLCNLIPRFYDLTGGQIFLDSYDIKQLTMASLRANIGIVQQEVYLFSGTIAENIAYGKDDATLEEIIQTAKAVGAHEFIMNTPNGYDSYVGERGVKLSGGQKQRISIARVFLKNPSILILDEATSALDTESEKIVKESLQWLSKGRTTITIAHRLSTIKHANRIIVLQNGKIEEEGTHENLMAKKGIYYKLNNFS